jgi:histidine triad (HIT) family protein
MSDCIFCKIAKKEIESYVIEETENFISFLDIKPHAPGHTLLIPKKHVANLEELPQELGEEFVFLSKRLITLLSKALETKDFTIGINHGKLAGQAVEHLHLHFIPRFKDDKGGSIHSVVYNPPKEELSVIYEKIMKVKNES